MANFVKSETIVVPEGGKAAIGAPDHCCEVERVAMTNTTGYDPSKEADPTNPTYYKQHRIEPIEIIEAYDLSFHLGNVIKYVLRWGDKNGLTDLKKARWYLDRFIKLEMGNTRKFKRIVVEYPSICPYPEYDGKPYFSIEYTKNGRDYTGYGTYDPEVLSDDLRKNFM